MADDEETVEASPLRRMPREQVGRHRGWRGALVFAACCVTIAFVPVVLHSVVGGNMGGFRRIGTWFGPNLLISASIGGVAWLTMPRVAPYLATRRFPLNVVAVALALLAIAATGLLLAFAILAAAGLISWRFGSIYLASLRIACLITLLIGAGVFMYETFKHRLAASAREIESRRQEAERSRQMAVEARLASLESRVHPHFLFNTLNSISALIREDPARAERLVERLAALLRFSLDSNQKSLVPLRREIKIAMDYLEIERARFGERLQYRVEAPDSLGDIQVPAMCVQTLVENCVKHAVSPRREGGQIAVTVRSKDGTLEIEVSDDGPGFTESDLAEGHGLETLRSRMAVLFGPDARLNVARAEGRTVVALTIPDKAPA